MTRARKLALAAILAVPVAAVPVLAQVPIRDATDRAGITISGTVADVFGNKFVLQDDSGKVLVESGPRWRQRVEVKPGEKVSVTGRPGDGTFEAFSITLADGRKIEVRPTEGPMRGSHGVGHHGAHGAGHGPHGGGHHGSHGQDMRGPGMPGAGPGGPGGYGRGPRLMAPSEEKSRSEILDLLRAAGYRDLDDVDRKRHHYEVEAVNRYGEKVEVHVDFAGNIYREKREN
ncbi:MAG: hypothetical protein AB7O45_02985 [Alphaproteobacteria bacterium]